MCADSVPCQLKFFVDQDSAAGFVEAGKNSLLCAVEDPKIKEAFRKTWGFMREKKLTPSTIALRLRPSLSIKRKAAAVENFAWVLRQANKNGKVG